MSKEIVVANNKYEKIRESFPELYFLCAGNAREACSKARISRQTFYTWINEYPEFREKIKEAQRDLIDFAESQLLVNIRNGKEASLFFYLKNKKPEEWKDRVENTHTGEVKQTISIQRVMEIIDGHAKQNIERQADRELSESKE